MNANVKTALGSLLLMLPVLQAQADTPGMGGLLDITGSLHHAPCVLDMTSAYQTVAAI